MLIHLFNIFLPQSYTNKIAFVIGKFDKFDSTMTSTKADFTDTKLEFTTKAKNINTGIEQRDRHLKSADFLVLKSI